MSGGDVNNVSLDIEACGEVVLSVGAVTFEDGTGVIGSRFYVVLDLKDQLDAGLKMDGEAFWWWMKQSEAARAIAGQLRARPADALQSLRSWWPDREARTWCYPSSYDLPVLARVFAAFHVKPPWRWTATLDVRTLWKLACEVAPSAAEIERDKGPDEHNALADAERQARWVARYLRTLGIS